MFLDEAAANLGADSGPMQSSIAVDSRVNGNHYVKWKCHGKHQVRLSLDLSELGRASVFNAVELHTSLISLSVRKVDNHD